MRIEDGIFYIDDHQIALDMTFDDIEYIIYKYIKGNVKLTENNTIDMVELNGLDFYGVDVICRMYFRNRVLRFMSLSSLSTPSIDYFKMLESELTLVDKDNLSAIYKSGKVNIIFSTTYDHKEYSALIQRGCY